MMEFAETETKVNTDVVSVAPVDLAGSVDRVTLNDMHMVVTKIDIKTPEEQVNADILLKKVSMAIKTIEATQEEKTKDLRDALDRIRKHFKKPLEILDAMKKTVKAKMLAFAELQERERIKQQEVLRQKAAAEAKKIMDRVEKAKAAGKEEKAQALAEQAAMTAANVPVVENKTKTSAYMKDEYSYRVLDPLKIPDVYWILDEKTIDKQVRASGGKQIIPGIEVITTKTMVSGR